MAVLSESIPTEPITPPSGLNNKLCKEPAAVSSPSCITEMSESPIGNDATKLSLVASVGDTPSMQAKHENDIDLEELLLKNVNVRVRRRPVVENEEATFDSIILQELRLPAKPTLDDMRDALSNSELGNPDRDIFFPKWNKSLYVMIDGVERNIVDSEQLEEIVTRELKQPGTFTLNLQECRDARYSRRKQVYVPQMFYPYMMYGNGNNAVYFDGAPTSYYHPYACHFMQPFPMHFMYVPMHGNQN